MENPSSLVAPTWPLSLGIYDYVLTLNHEELAWEFLRRNPEYQRNFRLSRVRYSKPSRLNSGQLLWQLASMTGKRTVGDSAPFVDPTLQATDAPVCWRAETGAAILCALSERPPSDATADLTLANVPCVRHIVVGPGDIEYVLVRSTDEAITIRLRGDRAAGAPVRLTFYIAGLSKARQAAAILMTLPELLNSQPRRKKRSRQQMLLRDALIALDGRSIGANYRETAAVIFGHERAQAAWSSTSTALKERMRRALKKGEQLRDGVYRRLLE